MTVDRWPARAILALVITVAAASVSAAQESVIQGRVRANAHAIRDVVVEVAETALAATTDSDGRFRVTVPPGVYTVTFRLGRFESVERHVTVAPGETVTLDEQVDWPLFYVETVSVTAPSRMPERMLETSAAVTTLVSSEVQAQASDAQVPRLLAFTPGAEVTQSGLYDFNLNARGFNTAVNRHVKTLIDGRDPSVPVLLGYQDWAANAFPLDDLDQAEFIRGPAGALYGAGAFNGVFSLTTRAPEDSPGGYARFSFGGLDTTNVDVRHAGRFTNRTFYKVTAGYHHSRDFARSRVSSTEYPGLPLEVIPLVRDHLERASGSLRIDHRFDAGSSLELEAGTAAVKGLTTVTSVGRTQTTDNSRPWARASFQSLHWHGSFSYSGQHTSGQMGLSTGAPIFFDASNIEGEWVGTGRFHQDRGQIVAGGSIGVQRADSANPDGFQTVFRTAETVTRGGGFVQVDYRLSDRLRAIAATRVDDSDVHAVQWSPRGALVWRMTSSQSLRAAIGRAFQSPSLPEFFLWTPVAPPIDLSPLEQALAPLLNGAALGFTSVPVVAAGNEHLRVETIADVEIGYSALVGGRVYATVDYYRTRLGDFTSNLLPQRQTALGVINPDFGAYVPPASLSAPASAAVLAALDSALPAELRPLLTNDASGAPVFVALSDRNIGKAHTQGLELGTTALVAPGWRAEFAASWFDHRIEDGQAVGAVEPNTPPHQWSAGITYSASRVTASARVRSVAGFIWSAGLFAGPVPAYRVTDLQAVVPITRRCSVGIDVANAFNDVHYEMFGGDLLTRRALGTIRYSW